MIKRMFIAVLVAAFALIGLSVGSASAAAVNVKKCVASNPAYVSVDKKNDRVTVLGNTATAGNNYGCYTNIPVTAGQTVTFDFIGTCGGGAPRVYLQFDGGASAGENTYDTGTCTQNGDGTGSVTYTIMKTGTVTAFALIYDRDNGGITYYNLVIGGTRINF